MDQATGLVKNKYSITGIQFSEGFITGEMGSQDGYNYITTTNGEGYIIITPGSARYNILLPAIVVNAATREVKINRA